MPDVVSLDVRLHGRSIGTLTRLDDDRTVFAFSEAYVSDPSRPTLSLSSKNRRGELITETSPDRRVPPFFANLLPEDALREYLAKRAGVHVEREFFLLWILGRDLPGAVSIHPATDQDWPPPGVQGKGKRMQVDRRAMLRFSLAGVQLKFSAVQNTGKQGGLAIPAKGVGGDWVVKLPSLRHEGVCENEFSMMALAREIDIDVPETRLLALNQIAGLPKGLGRLEGRAYAIRRFDRGPDGPVHVEDFAQVFGAYPEGKYRGATLRSLAHVLGIETDQASLDEFVRRVTFSILIGNGDMHLKNWSLIYPDKRRAGIAPAYDFVSTVPYIPQDALALRLYRSRAFVDVTFQEIGRMAVRAGISGRQAVIVATETVERFEAAWSAQKRNLPLSRSAVKSIDAHLSSLPLVKKRPAARKTS